MWRPIYEFDKWTMKGKPVLLRDRWGDCGVATYLDGIFFGEFMGFPCFENNGSWESPPTRMANSPSEFEYFILIDDLQYVKVPM